jgi:tRNA-dihydrouridine synthase A
MLGRAAYHDPWLLAVAGDKLLGASAPSRSAVAQAMHAYAERALAEGAHLRHITRHMLGLYHGYGRAKAWRRLLSDAERLSANDPSLILEAVEVAENRARLAA